MAYARTTITTKCSENSDFSDSETSFYSNDPGTNIKYLKIRLRLVAAAAQTVETGNFTTISSMTVANLNTTTTNYTTATFASADIASNKQRILKDAHIVLTDVLPTTDPSFTALTDNQDIEVVIIGTA